MWNPENDYSVINDVVVLDNNNLLISVLTKSDRQIVDQRFEWEEKKVFYFYKTSSEQKTLLGTLNILDQDIYFTDKHIIHFKEGNYFIASFELNVRVN